MTAARRTMRWRALRPLLTKDYRLLIGSVALSIFGMGMWTIVLVFQVFAIDDSPVALSSVVACLSIGLFVFALVGGVAADRFSRRTIVIVVQLTNTVAVGAATALALTGHVRMWHLAVTSAVLGAGSAFFYPAYSGYLPQVLPPEELLAANGLEGALRPTLQQAAGPALGGIIVGAFFPAVGAVAVTVLFAAAFVLTLFLAPLPKPAEAEDEPAPRTSMFADLRGGVRFVVRTRWLLWTLLFAFLQALVVMGPIEVLLPFIARDNFDNGEQVFGFLLTAWGAGGAIGSLAMSSWRLPRRYLTVMVLCWGFGSAPLLLAGLTTSFWILAAALFTVGFTTGAGLVIWGTLLQRRVPIDMIGRVASLDFFVSIALMPLSIALVGPIATVVPIPVIFLAAGLIPCVLAAVAVIAGRMPQDERAHPLDQSEEQPN